MKQSDLDLLLSHAEEDLPFESVSLLFGNETESGFHATRAVHMNNTLRSKTQFRIDPEELYSLLLAAERDNEELVGIFHSHPAPPFPSSSDISNMRLNPVVWIIASNLTGSWIYRGYILDNGKIHNVELVIL
ncbi:MAG: peptidase [Candidatus Lokiarchaeota archaeon]|nr:peptidase [Candidatus Lokiarchaeota archaeon]